MKISSSRVRFRTKKIDKKKKSGLGLVRGIKEKLGEVGKLGGVGKIDKVKVSKNTENTKTAEIYEKISKYAIYILVFLLPLFFLPWTSNVLDFNKQALLMVLVFISLFAWMIKVLTEGKICFNLSKFHIAAGALFLIYFLSTVLSLWPYGSFWGWPLTGSEGLFSMLCFFLFYLITVNIFKKKEIFLLMKLLTISAMLVVIFGILQIFGKFIMPWDFAKSASFNTTGSINKLGIFSAVMLPLFVGLFIAARKGIWKIVFAIAVILNVFMAVLINFSVIWWLVIIGAGLIMVFGLQRSDYFDNRFLILPMFILAVSFLFLFFRFQIPGLPNKPIEVFLTHKISMNIAVETLKERPILGSGPGTFIYDFSKHKPVEFNNSPLWNLRFENASSKVLGLLAELGLLGVLGYLGMLGLLGYLGGLGLVRGVREKLGNVREVRDVKGGDEWARDEWILSMGIFISFAVLSAGFFLYSSNLSLDFILFLMAAGFISLMSPTKKEFALRPSSFLTLGITFVFTLVFIFGLGLFILEGQRYVAEISYMKGMKAWQAGRTDVSLEYLEKSVKINPKTDIYWRELSQIYLRKINEEAKRTDIPKSEINQRIQIFINNAVNFSQRAANINPNNAANWSVKGFVYQNLVGIVNNVIEWVELSYAEALKLEPTNPYFPTQTGIAFMREAALMPTGREAEKQKNYEKAIVQFEKALELKPDYAPAHFQTAMAYQLQGRTDDAIAELEGIKASNPRDIGLAFQLGLIYYQNKNYRLAENELSRAVALSPNYSNALYFLGLAYDKQGKNESAIGVFRRLSNLNPKNSEVKKILRNLEEGRSALAGISEKVPPEAPIEEEHEEIE